MIMQRSYEKLPSDLPVPVDDGACDHLIGLKFPDTILKSTSSSDVDLSNIDGIVVVYCYPMTGKPGASLPDGWDKIPGARGCTPQSCSFRDRYTELSELGAKVYGISTQTTEYQKEMVERLHVPFPVLSDIDLSFCKALNIPMFIVNKIFLMKRVTMIACNGFIEAVHYPVFPSNSDASWVIQHLHSLRESRLASQSE